MLPGVACVPSAIDGAVQAVAMCGKQITYSHMMAGLWSGLHQRYLAYLFCV